MKRIITYLFVVLLAYEFQVIPLTAVIADEQNNAEKTEVIKIAPYAIRICKSVQWCVFYEPEAALYEPSIEEIYDDLKYIIDKYGPTNNYAQIDGKWLFIVPINQLTEASARGAANCWSTAKDRLAANGYPVYLLASLLLWPNAVLSVLPSDPWDAVANEWPGFFIGGQLISNDEGFTDSPVYMGDTACCGTRSAVR